MEQDDCIRIYEKVFKHLKTNWEKFIKKIRKLSDPDDQNIVFMDDFMSLMHRYKVDITTEERERLVQVFPAGEENGRQRFNIGKLYDQKYNMMLSKLYQKVDVHENDGEDDPVDQSGYTG